MNIMSIFQISYAITLLAFILQRYHLLMTLLCLEGMMLSMVLLVPSFLYMTGMVNIPIFALLMLTLGACEAGVGLSLMVNMSRSFGSDMFNAISSNKC